MESQGIEKMGHEDSARIDRAMEELTSWDLPVVWVGEPSYDDDPETSALEYLRLEQYGLAYLLEEELQTDVWDESMRILAARSGLVPVRKMLPMDGLGSEEARMKSLVRTRACRVGDGFYHGVVGPHGASPRPEDPSGWVQEGTVVLMMFARDAWIPYPTWQFTRFVARDKLTSEDLPYVEHFLQQTECGPSDTYSIEATDSLKLVASLYEGLDRV